MSIALTFECCLQFFVTSASPGDETRSVISAFAALGSLTLWAEDGAGRLSARLQHPAGPQTAFPRDPRGGSVTLPSAGTHTYTHTHLVLHMLKKVFEEC